MCTIGTKQDFNNEFTLRGKKYVRRVRLHTRHALVIDLQHVRYKTYLFEMFVVWKILNHETVLKVRAEREHGFHVISHHLENLNTLTKSNQKRDFRSVLVVLILLTFL